MYDDHSKIIRAPNPNMIFKMSGRAPFGHAFILEDHWICHASLRFIREFKMIF